MYHNYHKHTCYSNLRTLDCVSKPIDYIKRAKELGHTAYFTTEHGWQGNLWEAYTLCEQNGIKCISGAEVYYVDDRHEQDKGNYHLIIICKNKQGMKQLNKILSTANTDGYYYKPRVDLELMLTLNPKDVIVTSACVGSRLFKSEDYEDKFLKPMLKHFGKSFYLEIQCHTDDFQTQYNVKIKELAERYGIEMIHANDSHYVYEDEAKYRDLFLKAKGIVYEGESNFILDYPSEDTIRKRYKEQGVFTEEEVERALKNTLIFDECEDLNLTKDIKLPKVHKDRDSNQLLKEILNEKWKEERVHIPKERHKEYLEAIKYEVDIVEKTNMADYFILDYEVVELAKKKYDGVLTRTGRGSAPSFYINKLLGLTDIDRLDSPITLYPTRFMSTARILQTRSLPDIDLNWADTKAPLQATKDILGEDNVYFMVAYKGLQDSSAFRLWCKAIGMEINEYNDVAKELEDYVNDKKWGKIIEDSKVFRGVIESVSPSPCSYLLLDKPISEEVGLIKVGDVICCCLDGYNCDVYKFLKNDYLVVSVWGLISDTCKLANIPIPSIRELNQLLDKETFKMYELGLTCTLNQADSDFATGLIKKYKPNTVGNMSAFVASIRPGFASLLNNFIERKPYSTGVKELDEILTDSYHYLLYQESIMKFLVWLGIEESGTYDIIKKIAKKKFKTEELEELKGKLLKGWIKNVGREQGFKETWQVIEDASRYSFNASHSLSVGLDSLYGAYLKSHYPLEYYTIAFNYYKDDIERTSKLTEELKHFKIKIETPKFGYAKGEYFFNKETNSIYKGVGCIKNLNSKVGDELYELGHGRINLYKDFADVLEDLKTKTTINSRQLDILIRIGYFEQYGKTQKLLKIVQLFDEIYKKKQFNKAKLPFGIGEDLFAQYSATETKTLFKDVNKMGLIRHIADMIPNKDIPLQTRLNTEIEMMGYVQYKNPNLDKKYVLITDVNTKYTPVVNTYSLGSGVSVKCKIPKKIWEDLEVGSIIYIKSIEKRFGYKKVGEDANGKPKFEKDMTKIEWFINEYDVINNTIDFIIEELEEVLNE